MFTWSFLPLESAIRHDDLEPREVAAFMASIRGTSR
jgi:hypothetical protein